MRAREDSFVAYVLDQLCHVERIGCRAMFGSHGLYYGPTLFGIIFGDRLYLKSDGATAGEFVRRGMKPFAPGGRQLLNSYYEVPSDVLDDGAELAAWAYAAARAAGATGTRAAPTRDAHGVLEHGATRHERG